MSPQQVLIGIGISPLFGLDGAAGESSAAVSTGFLQEDGVSFILLETGEYLLQE